MGVKHDRLVERYSLKENITFIEDKVIDIYSEKTLQESLGILSPLTPDLIYIVDAPYVYVGEIKSKYSNINLNKAYKQVCKYSRALRRNGVFNRPFIIVADYIEVIEDGCVY